MAPSSREQRRHPRTDLNVKAKLSVPGDSQARFEATLATRDISVSGVFFESSFFLKLGQLVDVELTLPRQNRIVQVRGRVVRIGHAGRGANGFALKFEKYFGRSETVLKSFLLDPVLRDFVLDYAERNDIEADEDYVTHLVDLLAEWEFSKEKSSTGR